jgi:formylglycine-generating enzyme required for sulfatase activity/dienelactone hydrolase
MPAPNLGERVAAALAGRYTVGGELGRGGMATVYLGHDPKHDRPVAIKVLHPEIAAALGTERFLQEIRIAARLTHPHILPLHDSGEAAGLLFYVMPFVDGESLRTRLARERQLPVAEAVRITCEVADALSYAHTHQVVHRDIKPENILLEAGHAVVADFGIARAIGAAGGQTLTATGIAVGTPAYMSPEQAAASGAELDGRSDLYSLGCVLYEMLAGQPPFTGPTVDAVVRQHMATPAPSLERTRPPVPAHVSRAVARALAKDPAHRFADTRAFAAALGPAAPAARRTRHRGLRLAVAMVIALLLVAVFRRPAAVLWARYRVLPSLQSRVAAGDWETAYRLAQRVDAILPSDSSFVALRATFADTVSIDGTPVGARVYRRAYHAGRDVAWELLGAAPLPRVVLPRLPAVSQFKFEAPGFVTGYDIGAASPILGGFRPALRFALVPDTASPAGMVRVPGGEVLTGIPQLDPAERAWIGDFYIDRLEVTNREYQEFVDSGGYRRRDLWVDDFVEDGRRLTWEQALARFVDQTGRPGPATWEVGRYPPDRGDHPVSGVSWFEAAAYARFRGKRLPNVFQWARAARFEASAAIVAASNLDRTRDGTVPVGTLGGMTGSGALDMAGNVREWCFNEAHPGRSRYILGGGWNDPAFAFFESATHSPFDRTATNGIRLARSVVDEPRETTADRLVAPLFRDYRVERPVPDAAFQFFRRLYTYDPSPLQPRVERRDSSAQWIREKVSFAAAYGGERVTAYLFLPRRGRPPYQTVLYFPASPALRQRSSDTLLGVGIFDYLVQGGRAVIYPVYKGTYERGEGTRFSDPDPSNRYKEHVVQWLKDVSRSVDYLGTRPDLDTTKLGYLGFSWGGRMGAVILSIESRFDAAVLTVAGLNFRRAQPEVDDINYLPHVRAPVLMLNGRHDNTFPLETGARPMFELLGTPPDRKRFVIVDGVHYVPRHTLIRESLDWFDRYLGPVR